MLRMNTGVLIGLWAATAVAAFAVGRITTPPAAASAPEDIAASIRSALSHASALEGFGRTASLLQHLDPETLPEVLAVYDQMLSILDECDIRPFVDAWARFDSAAALDHTLAWPFKIKQEFGVQAAIRSWALHDPLEAQLAYKQTFKENRTLDQEGLFRNLLIGWVHSGQGGSTPTWLASRLSRRTRPPSSWPETSCARAERRPRCAGRSRSCGMRPTTAGSSAAPCGAGPVRSRAGIPSELRRG